MAILDDVIASGILLAKNAVGKTAKTWRGKSLKDLSEEERLLRKREMGAEAQRRFRSRLTDEQKAEIRRIGAEKALEKRHGFTQEQRDAYNERGRERWKKRMSEETEEQRELRLAKQREYDRNRFERETPEKKAQRLARLNERRRDKRAELSGLSARNEPAPADAYAARLGLMNDDELLALYRHNGDVDAFNEWYSRNVNHDYIKKFAYGMFKNNPEYAFDRSANSAGDYYLAARRMADAGKFNDSDHLLRLATNRYKFNALDDFRNEFGNRGDYPSIGRRNIETSRADDDYMIGNYSVGDDGHRQKEVESLLNGPVRGAFGDIGGEDIFEGLIRSSYEQAPNPAVTDKELYTRNYYNPNDDGFSMSQAAESIGMSRSLLHNKIKQVRERLAKKGIIGSNY